VYYADGTIPFFEFVRVYTRISQALLGPEFDRDKAYSNAIRDWEKDTGLTGQNKVRVAWLLLVHRHFFTVDVL
jgi:hypothetical protein